MPKVSKKTKEVDREEALVTQFPHIEELLQSENFDRINKSFHDAYHELEKQSKTGGLKKNREAKKVMRSIEKVTDLFKDLLKFKYQMQEDELVQKKKKK